MTSEIGNVTAYLTLVAIYFVVYSFALSIYFSIDKNKKSEISNFYGWMKEYVFRWIIVTLPYFSIYAVEHGYGFISGYSDVPISDFHVITERILPISWIFYLLSFFLILMEGARIFQLDKKRKLVWIYSIGVGLIFLLTPLSINIGDKFSYVFLWGAVSWFWIISYFLISKQK